LSALAFVVIATFLALIFNFLNGANDRANAIATVTSTKALTPINALFLAGFFNFLGALVSTRVAETIGKGIIISEFMTQEIIIAGLVGAIVWVGFCTKYGIPVSVTHSLVGGMMGGGIAAGGVEILQWKILTNKILVAIILGPIAGLLAGAILFVLISWITHLFCQNIPSTNLDRWFRKGQIFSASFMSFAHGMNDTQNAMGIITVALLTSGYISVFAVPLWVKIICGLVMGLGTFFMGWKVMKTLGWRIAKLEPKHGFVAETGAGLVIGIKSLVGMPVSTTHVVGSSVIGGSLLQNASGVRWDVISNMIIAWIITVPASGAVAVASYILVDTIF